MEGTDSVLVEIMEPDGNRTIFDKSRIAGFSSTSASFWGRLNGNISSGVSYAKGNETSTFSISSNVSYPRPRWSAAVGFNSNFSNSSGADAATRNQLQLTAAHLMRWNNWYYTGFGNGLQSSEQQITLQTILGGGVGRYLRKTSNVRMSVVGGMVWQGTSYESSVSTASREDMLGLMLLGTASYVKFKKTTLALTFNAIPSLTAPGRFYFNTNASYFLKLFGQINWNLSFYGNWDTQPPAGTSGNDSASTRGSASPLAISSDVPQSFAARYRAEFPIFERCIYLDSCSLGALSRRSRARVNDFLDLWDTRGASAWYEPWWAALAELRERYGQLVHAHPGSIALHPNVSSALGVLASAIDYTHRPKVVVTSLDFPTIGYQWMAKVREGVEVVVLESPDGIGVPLEMYERAVDDRTALIATSHVFFTSGAIQDVPALAGIARRAGALCLVDGSRRLASCRWTSTRSMWTSISAAG